MHSLYDYLLVFLAGVFLAGGVEPDLEAGFSLASGLEGVLAGVLAGALAGALAGVLAGALAGVLAGGLADGLLAGLPAGFTLGGGVAALVLFFVVLLVGFGVSVLETGVTFLGAVTGFVGALLALVLDATGFSGFAGTGTASAAALRVFRTVPVGAGAPDLTAFGAVLSGVAGFFAVVFPAVVRTGFSDSSSSKLPCTGLTCAFGVASTRLAPAGARRFFSGASVAVAGLSCSVRTAVTW